MINKNLPIIEGDRRAERVLVGRILRGERGAFDCFYGQTKDNLRRLMWSKVGNNEDVEELIQDTYLAFLDSLPLFSFKSSLRTFLYSIARHEVADHFRRKYAKRVLKLVPIVGEYVAKEVYSTKEISGRIELTYKKLLPKYGAILRLKYEEGMSLKRIAEKLRLSVKAAESRLFRARKAFQVAYETLENNESFDRFDKLTASRLRINRQ